MIRLMEMHENHQDNHYATGERLLNEGKFKILTDLAAGYGTFAFKKTLSPPKANEIAHMRPSNNFEDITEDEFNKRE
jgi:hypothetical protein